MQKALELNLPTSCIRTDDGPGMTIFIQPYHPGSHMYDNAQIEAHTRVYIFLKYAEKLVGSADG
jgi:hypothetical protein